MLRMTLELLPFGKEVGKKTLKIVEIANTMTHANPYKFGNYRARFRNTLHSESTWKYKYITDYPRDQYDALYLLYLVLRKFIHEYQQPIDKKAAKESEIASGCGHSLVPGVSSGVGQFGKRDSSSSGNISIYKRHIRSLKSNAVRIWNEELQKNNLP